jgi:hypothetical protein
MSDGAHVSLAEAISMSVGLLGQFKFYSLKLKKLPLNKFAAEKK